MVVPSDWCKQISPGRERISDPRLEFMRPGHAASDGHGEAVVLSLRGALLQALWGPILAGAAHAGPLWCLARTDKAARRLCTWLRQQRNVPPGPRDGTSPPPPLPAHLWTPAYVYRYLISTRFLSLAESLIRVTGPYCSINTHYTDCNFVRNRPPQAREGDVAAAAALHLRRSQCRTCSAVAPSAVWHQCRDRGIGIFERGQQLRVGEFVSPLRGRSCECGWSRVAGRSCECGWSRVTEISVVWREKVTAQPRSASVNSPIVMHDWDWVGGITNLIRFCKSAGDGWR